MLSTHSPQLRRRALGAAASVVAVAGLGAAVTPDAHALFVTSGADGLQMREPDSNILDRVDLSLVQSGGTTKYRVEMPEFGGRGMTGGPGCTVDPANNRQGLDIIFCDRQVPRVKVSLGAADDTFTVPADFPDPIDIFGGIGSDQITLGAGNDAADGGGDGDGIRGGAGDDRLIGGNGNDGLDGQAGNDSLIGNGGFDRLDGGEGDDIIELKAEASQDGTAPEPLSGMLIGGAGTDTFNGAGAQNTTIDSRDGIREQVNCGRNTFFQRFLLARLRFFRFSQAQLDLQDSPVGRGANGCPIVDRAPVGETTTAELVNRPLKLGGGDRVALRVKCTGTARCAGTASITVRGKRARAKYAIAAGRTATVRVPLSSSAANGLSGRPVAASVGVAEKGIAGPRDEEVTLPLTN